jgi:hypothetical protein
MTRSDARAEAEGAREVPWTAWLLVVLGVLAVLWSLYAVMGVLAFASTTFYLPTPSGDAVAHRSWQPAALLLLVAPAVGLLAGIVSTVLGVRALLRRRPVRSLLVIIPLGGAAVATLGPVLALLVGGAVG